MSATPSPVYNGRYELRSQIARGGTAQVYLAHDLLLDRPVALKVLFPELSADHAFVERFRREAQAAANLSHPNIVPVFDWGESDRTHFIVMEYVDGEPLSAIIRTQAPLPPIQAASIAADIAKALSYAHRHGVVHRDVKPGNVLITSDGVVKVTDFGIARAMGADNQVTQTGLVMGTATYFSPEQAQGFGVDGRSDVYALGVVLFEMLTGRPPFTGDTPVAIAYQHVREVAPAPRSLNPSIPPTLEAIVQQAMAKQASERYASADELRADLERFARGQPVLARPPALGEPSRAGPPAAPREPETSITTVLERSAAAAPKRTTPWWVLAGIILLAAIGAVVYVGGRNLGYFGGKTSFAEPAVTNLTLAKARARLRSAGLVPVAGKTRAGTKRQADHVYNQVPGPLTMVQRGERVRLDYYRYQPPPMATVPDVSNGGYTFAAARAALVQAGFKVQETFVKANSPSERQGSVIAQRPAPQSRQVAKSTVTVAVVSGSTYIVVPLDIIGKTEANAAAELRALQLVVRHQTSSQPSTIAPGSVMSTKPAPGSAAQPGSTVTLIISTGGTSVPPVVGYSAAAAQRLLQQAGLGFTIKNSNSTSYTLGTVAAQFPKAGTVVAQGRPIVLFVVGGAAASTTTTTILPSSSTTTTTTPSGTSSSSTTTSTSTTITVPASVPTG